MKKLLVTLLVLLAVGCTDDTATIRTLNESGYTDIQTTGYEFFSCGNDDNFSTGFTAKNPACKQVSGVVCCGIMKSCTVRF